ncbi:MAG: FMN-binding protein [Gammaproteobacteria bacterium]|nr:FMN-binding protein [Gammaproteobacteria bacterium]
MYRAVVGIATVCALVIVGVYRSTEGRIRDNRERYLKDAIAQVLPDAARTVPVSVSPAGRLESAAVPAPLPGFLAYDAGGALAGAVVTAEGMGYQDNIRILYAYSLARDAIVGLKVLDSKETPGLGDRIETDPRFTANFAALDAGLDAAGTALANSIVTVKQGEKTQPWQIDGITGATISSNAIGEILNASAGAWVPALERDAMNVSIDGGG